MTRFLTAFIEWKSKSQSGFRTKDSDKKYNTFEVILPIVIQIKRIWKLNLILILAKAVNFFFQLIERI